MKEHDSFAREATIRCYKCHAFVALEFTPVGGPAGSWWHGVCSACGATNLIRKPGWTKQLNALLSQQAREQGLTLHEPDDDILELRLKAAGRPEQTIARFSQTGVTIDNVMKVIKEDFSEN